MALSCSETSGTQCKDDLMTWVTYDVDIQAVLSLPVGRGNELATIIVHGTWAQLPFELARPI